MDSDQAISLLDFHTREASKAAARAADLKQCEYAVRRLRAVELAARDLYLSGFWTDTRGMGHAEQVAKWEALRVALDLPHGNSLKP